MNGSQLALFEPMAATGERPIVAPATRKPTRLRAEYTDEMALLRDLIRLHCPGGFDLDPAYSKGVFYKDGTVPQPRLRFDIKPQAPGVTQADCRTLPLEAKSIGSVIFDPPFIHAHGKDSVMGRRFGSYPSLARLFEMYAGALTEFMRVLRPGGKLAFKCMDEVQSGKFEASHCEVWRMARDAGFLVHDRALLVSQRQKLRGHNHGRQVHFDTRHCYWWIFHKPAPRRRKGATS